MSGWGRGCAAAVALTICSAATSAAQSTRESAAWIVRTGLHATFEARAGHAAAGSLWREGFDATLLDAGGTVRPLLSVAGGDWRFRAEVEAQGTWGDTRERSAGSTFYDEAGAAGDLPGDTSLLDLASVWSDGRRHRAGARVDRLSFAYSPSWGTVTLGRHAVTWGGGLVFNPFDLFNPFAPADVVRDYKRGDDMLHLDVPLTRGGFEAMAVARREPGGDPDFEQSSFAALWHTSRDWGEIALMAGWHFDEPVVGAGISGGLGEATWRIDATAVRVRPDFGGPAQTCASAVANLQYSWIWAGKNVFGLVEYYFSGAGASDYVTALADPLVQTQMRRRNLFVLGRHYAAASLQIELHPLVNAWLAAIANLQDPSLLVQPRVIWNASDRLRVTVGLDLPVGSRGSEFGGYAVTVDGRTTRQPTSAYGLLTWDF